MWVFCCGMMRSGSTLQYNIATSLAEKLGVGTGLGFLHDIQLLKHQVNNRDKEIGIKVLKVHEYSDEIRDLTKPEIIKCIYIYRDIRDVIASWLHMQDGTFEDIAPQKMVNSALENYYAWIQFDADILISRYETVNENLESEVWRIAKHLNLTVESTLVKEIAGELSLNRQKTHIESFDYRGEGVPSGITSYDPKTLLHNRHIRSGESGQYKTTLTRTQQQLIEQWAGSWLKETGYLHSETKPAEGVLVEPATEDLTADREITLLNQLLQNREADLEARLATIHQLQGRISDLEGKSRDYEIKYAQMKDELDVLHADHAAQIAVINSLSQKVEAQEKHLQSIRQRKIVRLMRLLGYPLT